MPTTRDAGPLDAERRSDGRQELPGAMKDQIEPRTADTLRDLLELEQVPLTLAHAKFVKAIA